MVPRWFIKRFGVLMALTICCCLVIAWSVKLLGSHSSFSKKSTQKLRYTYVSKSGRLVNTLFSEISPNVHIREKLARLTKELPAGCKQSALSRLESVFALVTVRAQTGCGAGPNPCQGCGLEIEDNGCTECGTPGSHGWEAYEPLFPSGTSSGVKRSSSAMCGSADCGCNAEGCTNSSCPPLAATTVTLVRRRSAMVAAHNV